jgi:hypothetical protein
MLHINDIFIFNLTPRYHIYHLQEVFGKLLKHNLKLHLGKCQFFHIQMYYYCINGVLIVICFMTFIFVLLFALYFLWMDSHPSLFICRVFFNCTKEVTLF